MLLFLGSICAPVKKKLDPDQEAHKYYLGYYCRTCFYSQCSRKVVRVFTIIRDLTRSSFEVDQVPSAFMQFVVHFIFEISYFYFCFVEGMHRFTIKYNFEYEL